MKIIVESKSLIILITCLCLGFLNVTAHGIDDARLKTYLDGMDYWNLRLSPDGKHLSVLTKQDDRNTLVVLDIATMKPTASVKYEENRKIEVTYAYWVSSDLLVYTTSWKVARFERSFGTPFMFLLSADGKRNDRIWSEYGNYEDNSRGRGKLVRGVPRVIAKLPKEKNRLMIYVRSFMRRDGAGRGGVYTLDLKSGDVKSVITVPEYTSWVMATEDGKVLVASTWDRQNQTDHFYSVNGKKWQGLNLIVEGKERKFSTLDVSNDFLYVETQDSDAINASTLIKKYEFSSEKWETVFDIGFASLDSIELNDAGNLTRLHWVDDVPNIDVLDKSDPVSRVVKGFAKTYPGFNISAVNETEDKKKLLINVSSGAHRGEYFLYDFETKSARFLVAMMEGIDGNELRDIEKFTFKASDGVRIPGWFMKSRHKKKAPLVVYVHGGPHGPYNQYDFNTRWHLLNEMGYAVYAPNFRGSGGYGINFEESGYGSWGTRMLDDVREGVQALIDQKRVDPKRVCILGGSYGGYASVQSLVRHNDFYSCGVIVAGIFDLTTQIKRTDTADWYAGNNFMAHVIGEDKARLRDMSAIFHMDKIKAPMLIIHGEEDERTPFKGAVEFVKALEGKGKDFTYQWYEKEGHGNVKLENRMDEWKRIQDFLTESM